MQGREGDEDEQREWARRDDDGAKCPRDCRVSETRSPRLLKAAGKKRAGLTSRWEIENANVQ